jgi:predicted kinase
MPAHTPIFYFMCGRRGSGKTTRALEISQTRDALLLSEHQEADREKIAATALRYLKAGRSVVIDFGGNTRAERAWSRKIFAAADCRHELHFIDISPGERDATFQPPKRSEGFNVVYVLGDGHEIDL